MDDLLGFLAVILLLVGAFFVGVIHQHGETEHDWQTETVERGLAIYCPQDGKWAWKGECDESNLH